MQNLSKAAADNDSFLTGWPSGHDPQQSLKPGFRKAAYSHIGDCRKDKNCIPPNAERYTVYCEYNQTTL